MTELLFASSNKAKIEQFQFVADSYEVKAKVISVYDRFPQTKPYSEDYGTQFEIVEQGAREVYALIKQPVIVEDAILEIIGLDGGPGLTAREYLEEKGLAGLIKELDGKDHGAVVTSIVGYFDGQVFSSFKNAVLGEIVDNPVYKDGEPAWIGPSFHPLGGGFNPVFYSHKAKRTLANMSAEDGLVFGYREPNFKKILELLSCQLGTTQLASAIHLR